MSWQPIYDEKGKSQGYRASIRDITDRKRAEETLAHERNLLRTLIDSMPDYICVKDIHGRYLIANAALTRYVKAATTDEMIGKTDYDFYQKELADEYFEDEQKIIEGGEPLINKVEASIAPGSNMMWLLAIKVPLRDVSGNIVGIVSISRNITELRNAWANMKNL